MKGRKNGWKKVKRKKATWSTDDAFSLPLDFCVTQHSGLGLFPATLILHVSPKLKHCCVSSVD